jgi:hypothetical protein
VSAVDGVGQEKAEEGIVMRAICLLVILLASLGSQAQSQLSHTVVDRMLLNSTVLISYQVTAAPGAATDKSTGGNKPPQILGMMNGSGFLLFRNVGISKGSVYLVTNRHVLPPEGTAKEIQLRVIVREDDGTSRIDQISIPIVGADGKYLSTVRVHKDPATDVAAVDIGSTAFGSKFQVLVEAVTTGRYLNTSMLLTTDRFRDAGVDLGTRVFILGYPAAIFDPRNVMPVLRSGVISTDPKTGFSFNEELRRTMNFPEHMNGFLIDANVYPGSSGSLVIAAPDNWSAKPNEGNRAPSILGIVSGSIPIFDASLRSYERIGLGMVYSADTIKEVLDSFLR